MTRIIKERGLRISILFTMTIVCINVVLVMYYRNVIINSSETREKITKVQAGLNMVDNYIRQGDIGARGYILKQHESILYPINQALTYYSANFDSLELALADIGYDVAQMEPARKANDEYMQTLKTILNLCDEGKIDEAFSLFEEDRGVNTWERMVPFFDSSAAYIADLAQEVDSDYKSAINLVLVLQVILIVLVVPILIQTYRKITKDSKFRTRMFSRVESSNRSYLFDDGDSTDVHDEDSIINSLVQNLERAADFIKKISAGDFSVRWEGMDKKKQELNKSNIAGELVKMRDLMAEAKSKDDIRIWTNEGLSNFADLIRSKQDNTQSLADELISQVVQYMGAQQGGLFLLNEDHDGQNYLEMTACYAYQRKKFLEKRIQPGQGLIGQCYLEAETTHIKDVPTEYVNITSGLGDTNPNTLLVVPLKMNEEVVGVIELASIKSFADHKIQFLERLAENIASSISSIRINEKTHHLLLQSQQQAEEMKSQEEEMRQNMEELQATQEQMSRKTEEVEVLLKGAEEKEAQLKEQMEKIQNMERESKKQANQMKVEAQGYKSMMIKILNELPQKVFLKDADGKIIIANDRVAETHGMTIDDLIGKTDYHFVEKELADQWKAQEELIIKKGKERYVFEEKIGGKVKVLESIKRSFL